MSEVWFSKENTQAMRPWLRCILLGAFVEQVHGRLSHLCILTPRAAPAMCSAVRYLVA